MRAARRVVVTIITASVLLIGAAGPALASDDPASPGSLVAPQFSSHDDGSTINVTQEFSLTPSTPGEVSVRLRFSVPRRVIALSTTVPDDAEVTAANGFQRGTNDTYDWDETTARPTLTYDLPVNETLNDTSPEGADGDLVAVDAGEWALFERPPTPVDWENYAAEEPIEFNRTTATDGPGSAGEWLVFLGEHDSYEHTASDQRFRLVVPSNATMSERPHAVLDSLADASDALRIGDRDDEVFVVAAPTDGVQWGVRGLQTGESDMWVRDVEPVDSPDNPWVHEYVHSRQEFGVEPEMRWFPEASASYYAALLTYEQGHVRYDAFSDRIGTDANASDDAVLANQSTWQASPHYDRGALVAGELDRRIRTAREGERTLQSVMSAMNEDPDAISLSDFLTYLGEHGAESVVDTGGQYVETAADVSMWNRTAHVAAFGDPPARVGFQLPTDANDGAYVVNGSARNATVGDGDGPIVLVPGERLRVGAVVENAGGRTGNFTAALAVNDTVVDRASGSVGPNETVTAGLNHTFATTGTYELALGGNNRTVEVREPADGRVTDVAVSSREVRAGDAVTVSATVENDDERPGEATVTFRRGGERFVSKPVRVGPESTELVDATMMLLEPGTTPVGVDGAEPVEITVRSAPNGTAARGTTTVDDPVRSAASERSGAAGPSTANATDRPAPGDGPPLDGATLTLVVAVTAGLALVRRWR